MTSQELKAQAPDQFRQLLLGDSFRVRVWVLNVESEEGRLAVVELR